MPSSRLRQPNDQANLSRLRGYVGVGREDVHETDHAGTHRLAAPAGLLGLSFSVAMRALRLPGAKDTGPSIDELRRAREAEKDEPLLEDSLLDDLEEDLQTNDQALDRKIRLFDRTLTFLVLAILVELAGRLVQ
jgi:hypothetical protein